MYRQPSRRAIHSSIRATTSGICTASTRTPSTPYDSLRGHVSKTSLLAVNVSRDISLRQFAPSRTLILLLQIATPLSHLDPRLQLPLRNCTEQFVPLRTQCRS